MIGDVNAAKLMLVISGTHGVEGYYGSDCQIAWLYRSNLTSLPADTAIVMVHLLNPWGAAHLRRVNEDNIDLNRNFIDFSQAAPANPAYMTWHDFYQGDRQHADLRLAETLSRDGWLAVKRVVEAGQYVAADGFFYGGQAPRLPKISVIQAFKVAAEQGSLAKAAAQLALTPAAVSQQIRQLEEQLGSTLFLRTQSGVMLTKTGKEYLRYVIEAFDILHLVQQNLLGAAIKPKLTLYSLPALVSKWLLPNILQWREQCPDIDLALHGTHAQVDFNSTPADFVICFGEDRYP